MRAEAMANLARKQTPITEPEKGSVVAFRQLAQPWTCEDLARHYRQIHKTGRRKGLPNVKWVQERVRSGYFIALPTGSRALYFDPENHLSRPQGEVRSVKTESKLDKYSSRPVSRITRRKERLA